MMNHTQSNKQQRVVDFLVGVLFGTLTGVTVGLLIAPRSGAESRHQIAEGLKDVKDRTGRYLDDTKYHTEESMQQIKHMIEDKFNQLLDTVKT